MLTYGFYNSLNHDRRYDAIQMSSIFDGIIRDGVYMTIGDRLNVKASSGMIVLVGTGRAWFDHTWTLNDSLLPVEIPQSEVILNRIDAIVLEVNHETSVRANAIKVIKGTPSSNAQRPTLRNELLVKQFPLAYISVAAQATSIRQANITNMVGTSQTPFVTGVLEAMNIDSLVAQWGDQWQEFFEKETADMSATNAFWKRQWATWFEAQTTQIQQAYLRWEAQWNAWYEEQTTEMTNTKNYWAELWHDWFHQYVADNEKDIYDWKLQNQQKFDDWLADLNAVLDGDVATNLANELIEVKNQITKLENFKDTFIKERTVYDILYDDTYTKYEEVLDGSGRAVLDSESDPIISRTYRSEPILDSDGNPIEGRLIFAII